MTLIYERVGRFEWGSGVMNIYTESISRYRKSRGLGDWLVRVWRQEELGKDADWSDVLLALEAGPEKEPGWQLAKRILEVDRVNAVEVTDEEGMGWVLWIP